MDLLALHAKIMDELRARNIVRSSNNPVGDVAETLFCRAFGWKQSGNSSRSVDAIGRGGKRYQIKGRRLSRLNASRQMSAIRNLDGAPFDFLAGVLFAADYTILRAAIIPAAVVAERASFVKHTNSHRFLLRDDVWTARGVRDVTEELKAVTI